MSEAAKDLRRAMGSDILVTANGFEYSYKESIEDYDCTTPDCEARENDPHSDECWQRANRRQAAA